MERVLLIRGDQTFKPTKFAFDNCYETVWKPMGFRPASEEFLSQTMEEAKPVIEPKSKVATQGQEKPTTPKKTNPKKTSAKQSTEE